MTGAIAPTKPLNALDVCDRCGAQAYVRVVLAGSGELLFCAHHNRQHADALAKIAIEIQDETARLTQAPGAGCPARLSAGGRVSMCAAPLPAGDPRQPRSIAR